MIGRMKNPPHPGGIIAETLEDTGISLRELAKRLEVAPSTLSRLINKDAAVSAEMAVKLAAVLGIAAHIWLGMQSDYDLAQAEKALDVSHLKRLEFPAEPDATAMHH
ncbi:TPA: HigA family addiction module antidote protein [Klebsiella aerogenes]|nr:HigA family addiction module antidote protein [Klebsiella aerogenes]